MIINFTAIAAILIAGLLGAPSVKTIPSEALGPVQYEVRYSLAGIETKVADATISLEEARRDGQAVLHLHASIKASTFFQLFMNPEYIADSYITLGDMEPVYYMNPIKNGRKTGKFECIYDKKGGIVSCEFSKPGADPVYLSTPNDGFTMDLLTLIQFVRFHDIPQGKPQSMHLLMAGQSVKANLKCEGLDKERFKGREAVRYHLEMIGRGLMENGSGNEITVWCSTSPDHQLLGLSTDLGSGVMSVSISEK